MPKSNPADLEDWAAEALFFVRMREREWEDEGDHYDERRWSHERACKGAARPPQPVPWAAFFSVWPS